MKKYGLWLFVAAVTIVPLTVFAIAKWYENKYTSLPVMGGEKHVIAHFNLVNQYSGPSSLKDWDDKIVVADFFFTHCPVVCPKMTRSLKRVQEVYINDKDLLLSLIHI